MSEYFKIPSGKRFVGINFDGLQLGDRDYALEVAQAVNAISYTSMDDWGFTKQLQSVVPGSNVSHRLWSPFGIEPDTHTYLEVGPIDYCNRLADFGDPETLMHLLNEPTSDNVPYLVDWLIAAMDYCGENGVRPQRLLVGNLAVDKSFQHQGKSIRWESHWLRLGEAFQRHLGWHVFGMTNYFMGDYRASLVPGYPHNLLDDEPDWVNEIHHRAPKLERLPNGDLPPYWHGYAYLWWFILLKERGYEIPYHKAQETLLDEKWDEGSELIQAYISINYPNHYNNGIARGLWTWEGFVKTVDPRPYVSILLSQFDARTTIHEQLERENPELRGKQLGDNVFQWTTAKNWEKAGHSIFSLNDGGQRALLHQGMASVRPFQVTISDDTRPIPSLPELPEPDDEGWSDYGEFYVLEGLRLRKKPGIDGEIITQLGSDGFGRLHDSSFGDADGFRWRAVEMDELPGFVAEYKLSEPDDKYFTHYVPEEMPEPDPPVSERQSIYMVKLGERSVMVTEFEREIWLERLNQQIDGANSAKYALEHAILISEE